MTNPFKKWIEKNAHATIQKAGFHCQIMYVDDRLLAAAKIAISEAERVGTAVNEGGLFKRQTADRVLSNLMPDATEHDRMNAIQVALEVVANA